MFIQRSYLGSQLTQGLEWGFARDKRCKQSSLKCVYYTLDNYEQILWLDPISYVHVH